MKVTRIYTGTDGHSHFDEVDVEIGKLQAGDGILFRQEQPGHTQDWHPAPRRQWVVILRGKLEIGLGDGTFRRFGPGDARLVEDTTGPGHTTRVVGRGPCLAMYVPVGGDAAH